MISDGKDKEEAKKTFSTANLLLLILRHLASGATIRTLMHGSEKINAIAVDTWETPLESKIPLGKK